MRAALISVVALLALGCGGEASIDANTVCGIGTPYECDAGPADAAPVDACIEMIGRPTCCILVGENCADAGADGAP